MSKEFIFVVAALALARAQIPSLGWCPEYVPMANFDMNRFLGVWYEAERYFQLSEVVSRCVTANYTKGPDGKLRVSNEVTNRFTGIKRVLEGEIKPAASKAEEGKLQVKYTTIPLTPETKYSVLETDYDSYAVLWSCSGIGPVHTQNAWIMTRERLAPGAILQKAYGVLDKYKISKTFFVKTDQDDCAYLATKPEEPAAESAETPAEAAEEAAEGGAAEGQNNLRSAIIPDAPEVIVLTRKAETEKIAATTEQLEDLQSVEAAALEVVKDKEPEKQAAVAETVPETIMKVASQVKEAVEGEKANPVETPQASVAKEDPEERQAEKLEAKAPAQSRAFW